MCLLCVNREVSVKCCICKVLPSHIISKVLSSHIISKVLSSRIASIGKDTHITLGKQQMKVTTPEGNKAGIVKAVCRFINCKDVVDYEVGTVGRRYPA